MSLADIKREYLKQLDDLPDIVIKDIWVRQELYSMFRNNMSNFYDSGRHARIMDASTTKSREEYASWLKNVGYLAPSKLDEFEQSSYGSLIAFLFDDLTKDGVTVDDARDYIQNVYGGTSGTPGDDIISAVLNMHATDDVYTMMDTGDDVKIYKGNHTNGVPDKRASRVTSSMEQGWGILREFAKNRGHPLFVIYQTDGLHGDRWNTTLVRPEE